MIYLHTGGLDEDQANFIFEYLVKVGGPNVTMKKDDDDFKAKCQACYQSNPCKTYKVKRINDGTCTSCQWGKWSAYSTCQSCNEPNRRQERTRTRSLNGGHTNTEGTCDGDAMEKYPGESDCSQCSESNSLTTVLVMAPKQSLARLGF